MRRRYPRNTIVSLTLLMTVALLAGCHKIYENRLPSTLNMSFRQREKVPLRAGLYLPADFSNYTHEWELEFGTHTFPLGGMLRDGSEKMVRAAFEEVVILPSLDEAGVREVDIIMSPQVEVAEYAYKTFFSEPPVSMVMIQWKATDPAGNIIWADTFEGRGQIKKVKGARQINKYGVAVDNMGLAIKDSLDRAYEGILSSTWWRK